MSSSGKCPVDHAAPTPPEQGECPVDHSSRSIWSKLAGSLSRTPPTNPHDSKPKTLDDTRQVSTIPRNENENWVYPSESQFFAAMARKNHNPRESDMKVVVPIHNAVNERAWGEILRWEAGWGGDKCGGIKLVSFKGRPKDLSPRARLKTLLGYQAPFDRHDWIVDRCGTRMRYVIDFYSGRQDPNSSNTLSFYLDTRPAYDNWEAVKMRASMFWNRWMGNGQ